MSPSDQENSYIHARVLRLNIGFVIAESAGFSRVSPLNIPQRLQVADDLMVEHLIGDIRLTRTSEGVLLQGLLECSRILGCSRCLEEATVSFEMELEELFSVGFSYDTPFFVGEDGIMNLAPLIREETFINTPTQVLCHDGCQGLCRHCGHNLNHGNCDCERDVIDPRWAVLHDFQKRLSE